MDINTTMLESLGYIVHKNPWKHWFDESAEWNPTAIINDLKNSLHSEKIILIAKSLGTFIAVNLLAVLEPSQIRKVVLMGIPVFDLNTEEKQPYQILLDFKDRLTLIHNRNDNHGGIVDLNAMLNITDLDVRVEESDNHMYAYPDLLKEILNANVRH